MNKTWSIILIVVACIVVLGGTYWYFGMQKPKPQQEPTASVAVQPIQEQTMATKEKPAAASSAKTEPTLPKEKPAAASSAKTEPTLPKEKPAPDPSPPKAADAGPDSPGAGTPKQKKQMPAPIAPVITKGGGFALPSSLGTNNDGVTEKEALTSVLASEELPAKAESGTIAAKVGDREMAEDKEAEVMVGDNEPQGAPEEPALQAEQAIPPSIPVQESEQPEPKQTETSQEVVLSPVEEKPVTVQPKIEQIEPATAVKTPPVIQILRSETVRTDEETAVDKPELEANLSVSFLDYNFPTDFSSQEKSFNVSVDVLSQNEVFGWGGTLEVGKNTSLDVVQISLLGKAVWRLGKGMVTYPLSISLGPTLFIDSTANTTEFGMKAKLGAGVTYAISESFRMFYSVGLGTTLNFQDSSSFRFVMEPIRIGVGFSF